jgi:hypothetical protein
MGSTRGIIFGTMNAPSEAIIQKGGCFGRRYPEFFVFPQSTLNARDIDVPLLDVPGLEERGKRIKLPHIFLMDHRGYRNTDAGLPEVVNRLQGLLKRASAPDRFVTILHAVEADLNLVDTKSSGDSFRDQRSIGQKDGSKFVAPQKIIDFPEGRMQQWFSPGKEKTKSVDFFKLSGSLLDHFKREVLIPALPEVAVSALEIATVGHDELEISKRRGRCRKWEDFSQDRLLGNLDEILR